MKFILVATLISSVLISCQSEEKPAPKTETAEDPAVFFKSIAENGDSLFLNARFDECGEWGGHIEKMEVYGEDEQLYLSFQQSSVNCDSMTDQGGPLQTFEPKKVRKIGQKDAKAIADYLQRMVLSKAQEEFPGHSGNIFSVTKSDSSLFIWTYGYAGKARESYDQLLKELKLPAATVKQED